MKDNLIKTAFVEFGKINSSQELVREMCLQAREEVKSPDIEVVSTGHVTDDPEGKDVQRVIDELKKESFDSLVLCNAGWIPSHAVISITEEFKDKPMVFMLLSDEMNLCTIPENDAMGAVTQLVVKHHTGHCYLKDIEVV